MGKLKNLTYEQTLNLSLFIGKLLLENGAETSRVEEYMLRICYHYKIRWVNVFVTPTFIILGEDRHVGQNLMCRVTNRSTNLNVLSCINDLTYNLDSWELDYDATIEYLKHLAMPRYKFALRCVSSGFGAAFFAILLNGSLHDFAAAFIVASLTMLVVKLTNVGSYGNFLGNIVTGAGIAVLATACCVADKHCGMDVITASALMVFLPGLAFTNGLRDFIAGDLISGNSRVSEAVILCIALTVGLGVALILLWQCHTILGVYHL